MRLKQCIFALMAMLLCAFSANAQGSGVAKIGSTTYDTFTEALTAANEMSGDVTIEVYDKVTLNTAFSGSYSSINFVGKDTDAEIYLDVQGYITATGKKVSFTDLTLSKSEGDYLTNAGFMNVAFGIYDVVEVTYTNCVFANGAYASSGNVTFTGCTFKKSWEKYGLWAYGNVNVAVEGCKFDNDRGIKMYAEDKAKTTDLTVKSCDFSALTGKPAIVLTYGESVVLEGNTYSSTGTFELDKDGDPNGTAVTSDVAPTCMNDDYPACGVLVDGKIYTTAAQAAEVAAEGSNVTLLYSTTDAVEFAEGVNLTLADGVTAENVTVATSAVAKIGETSYATLAEAIAAVGAGDVVIELLDDVTLDYGAREAYGTAETTSVTINGNGKTLTLNQTNSDWSSFGLAAGKVAFNNVTIEKTGYGDTSGAWNTHAIIFSSPVEMTNVIVNNSMAVQAGATLNNVTINEANGYYGLWVNGNGQTVTMNGGAINATNGGRGIKVADQYIDAPAQVTLNVTGTAFNTAKKAAVLVSSTAGAKIAASNVDITNVAADNQSMVWVDEDWAANYGAVEVTGATVVQEAVESFPIVVKNGENVVSYFKTLQDAIDAVQNGETIEFLGDITETLVTIEKASGVAFTIDGKGNSFTGEFEIGIGENINIQNINFVASAEISPEYFIDSMDQNSNCVLNITGCTFTDTDYSTTAIGTHQPTKVVIDGCTTSGVASLLQNQGGYNITVKNTTVEGKRGISLGTVVGATVEKVTIKAADDKYGIRLNGEITNNTITIKDCDIQAFIPVVVRKAQVENYNVVFDGTNTMTAKNTDGLWCAIGDSEYEENGVMPTEQTGKVTVTLNDTGLSREGVYGNYFTAVAKIGDVEYETLAEAVAAAESGATITLMNGEHELPAFSNKELTFVGESKEGVIVNDAPDARTQGWVGSTIHFENLTAKGATGTDANYHGLANGVVALTYKNCNINGLRFLYADTVSFEGCAFNAEGVEHSFWTYGSSNITVKNSSFTYTDRAVNCYSENGAEHETDITFEGCSFTYAGTSDTPAGAVEINSGSVKSIDLIMNDCTAPEKGAMWFNSQWDSKKGENTVVTVDGVVVWKVAPAVAKIGETKYATLEEAFAAAAEGDVVTLVWAEGNDPIAMNGSVFGKSVTITGTATVDWSKGFLFVGRGGEGNGTVTFDGANLTSASDQASTGIHVSGREKDTDNKYNGTLVIKNSTIELDYLINKNTMSLDNSTLTVKNGFSIGGRPASETESGADATATISLANNSKVIVNNHNGMGLGYEAIGVMNIDTTSTFEATQAFLVTAKGTMNVAAGGAVNVNGTLTVNGTLVSAGDIAAEIAAGDGATIEISGGVYTQDVNEWCVDGYAALPDLNGNYVVGVKPTATVNNLGMTTVAAGEYMVYGNGENTADMPLSFVMQFLADQTEADMAASPYADWYGDFVITFTGIENGSFTANGCYLAGHYGSFGWVKVPVDGMTIEENAHYPVMLGVGMGQKYDYICSSVQDFKCALYLTPEILEANPNIQVKLELAVVDNSNGEAAAASALVNNENVYSVTDYTYDAEDFVVDPNYIAELTIDDANPVDYTSDFEGKTVGKLTYKRSLIGGIWNPFFVPFEIDIERLVNEFGLEVAYYNQMISTENADGGFDYKMEVKHLTSGVISHYPLFVKVATDTEIEYVAEDVVLGSADEFVITTSSVTNTFKLYGTHQAKSVSDLEGKYAINASNGLWTPSTSGIKPHRLYFEIQENNNNPFSSSPAKSIGIVVRGEEGFTGIEEVTGDANENVIFDLQGRRILEPQKGELYIINGKKVIY